MIEVSQWLADRTPRPPAELAERLASLAGGIRVENEVALAEFFVQEAAAMLGTVAHDRSGATQLLLADALITYAMEAAAADHDRFEDLAERAMITLAAAGRASA